jgi:hypothetical protein
MIHAVRRTGSWNGSRRQIRIELRASEQPDLNGARLQWKATKDKRRYTGTAINVFDALEAIASQMRQI